MGAIQRAGQGDSSIADLDSDTPAVKRVRVATTIDYALEE